MSTHITCTVSCACLLVFISGPILRSVLIKLFVASHPNHVHLDGVHRPGQPLTVQFVRFNAFRTDTSLSHIKLVNAKRVRCDQRDNAYIFGSYMCRGIYLNPRAFTFIFLIPTGLPHSVHVLKCGAFVQHKLVLCSLTNPLASIVRTRTAHAQMSL